MSLPTRTLASHPDLAQLKRQAKELVEREARRAGMPYVCERWLGGTLTNYRTIRNRLKRLALRRGWTIVRPRRPPRADRRRSP